MNSKQLQIEFKDVYKKFYHENQIVISTPFVMNRAGDIHSKYSGLSIKQKIPLRLYFGLKKIDTPSFEFDNIIYFDTNVSSFVDTTCSNYLPYGSQIIKYLNSEYKHLLE